MEGTDRSDDLKRRFRKVFQRNKNVKHSTGSSDLCIGRTNKISQQIYEKKNHFRIKNKNAGFNFVSKMEKTV